MNKQSVKKLTACSLFAALICVATAVFKLPVASTNGYVHLGDMFIFVAGSALGKTAILPAAIGSALADLLAGYPVYIAPTLVIKGVMGYVSGRVLLNETRAVISVALLISLELFMVAGYFAFEALLYGVAPAAAAIPMNLVQGAFGAGAGALLIKLIPKRIYKTFLW